MEHIRANRAYFAFLGWITLLAIPLALLTVLYLAGLRVGSDFVRTVLPSQWLPGVDPRLLTIGVATAAGLLVGLILRYLGGSDSRALSDELVEEGKVAYRNLPGMILAALVGLSSGASLGPEGPLAHLGGGLGTWLAERRRFDRDRSRVLSLSGIAAVFGGFLTQPLGGAFLAFEFTKLVTFPFYIYLIPAIVASLAGYLVYFAITGASLVGLYQFDEITTLKVTDFLYVFVLSLMGVGVGILFKLIFRTVQR
ncbi:MAG: chloride channel protein, partial [Caldilineaceae bacterium]|nr:chloride channel protein [Caldilineaceae bacterium]